MSVNVNALRRQVVQAALSRRREMEQEVCFEKAVGGILGQRSCRIDSTIKDNTLHIHTNQNAFYTSIEFEDGNKRLQGRKAQIRSGEIETGRRRPT